MQEKDKQILQSAALEVADKLVSGLPGLNVAWGMSKALFGAGLKLRQNRALEWVEMVRDNPGVFTEKVLSDENFQDGFVYALERYVRERSEQKRQLLRAVFLGFADYSDRDSVELERMCHVLTVLNDDDLRVMRRVDVDNPNFHQVYDDDTSENESVYNLVSVGILMSDYSSRFGPITAPFVKVTEFGRAFVGYLKR